MSVPASRRRLTRQPDPPAPEVALEIALRFLGTRPRSRREVEDRLARAGADASIIESVVARLEELGYVDDAAFARWWGEQRDRHAPRGRRLLEAELRRSGVPAEVIEAYRDEHASPRRAPEDEGLPGTEDERARDALVRHLKGRAVPTEPKALQRLGMFLMRRGFDPETVRGVLRRSSAPPKQENVDDAGTRLEGAP